MTANLRPNLRVVIVGASVAGVQCANALRNHGFGGSIVVIDVDEDPLFDKPQLSKRLRVDTELERLVEASALQERGICLRAGVGVHSLDLDARVVNTSDGLVQFDELVIASGCRPRPLSDALPPQAGYLRTRQDWEQLSLAVQQGGHLLIIGGGFLGLEVASTALRLGMTAEVVDVAPRLLARSVPHGVAQMVAERHEVAGVRFRLGQQLPVLTGDGKGVEVLGSRGDYALVSIGAVPNTEWLAGSGLQLENGVVCDTNLAAAPGVWAVGDCARWVNARYGQLERHEHWTTASRHAAHVGRSIATGSIAPMSELPYVWSDQYDWKIQSVGRTGTAEFHFKLDAGHVVLSTEADSVTGVVTINAENTSVRSRMMLQRENPNIEQVIARLGLPDPD